MFTTTQVKDGIDTGDLMLDLSDYMKKKDAEKLATKSAVEELIEVVAGKLDATPQHRHHIDDVKQLQESLNSKYDKSEKYSHNVILNDIEKISYLEAPKIELMEIVKDKDSSGYKFYVDDANGDLIITLDDVLIASYFKATGKWSFNGIGSEDLEQRISKNTDDISSLSSNVNSLNNVCNSTLSKITEIENILKNHYDALLILCQKHGMVDSNTGDGSNVTPK